MYTTLIEPTELAAHRGDANWAVLDCRFDLARPDWGASAFAAVHVPEAIYAHLDRDLSAPVTAGSGRHPLPSPEDWSARLAAWGIDERVQVIAYDQGSGAYAARLWWLLRWAGHGAAAVLNGGFAAWQQAGLPVSEEPGARRAREFAPSATGEVALATAELQRLLEQGRFADGERVLIDARAADRFAGQNETIDPVAGHIPGAINHPFARNLDAQGRFLPAQTLRSQWEGTLRGAEPANCVVMCGSGVTACHDLLAMEVAGLTGAKLYAGSWSEWIRDAARPVATGSSASQ